MFKVFAVGYLTRIIYDLSID